MSVKGAGGSAGRFRPVLLVLFTVGAAITLAWATGLFQGLLDSQEPTTGERPRIVVSSQRLDFGTLALNKPVVRQLVLLNEGVEPVQARISVEDSTYIVTPDRLMLEPGASARISVTASRSQSGDFSHELRIVFDIDDSGPLLVALQGRVEAILPDEQAAQPWEQLVAGGTGQPETQPILKTGMQVPARGYSQTALEGVDRRSVSLSGQVDTTPKTVSTAMAFSVRGDPLQEDPSSSSAADDAVEKAESEGEEAKLGESEPTGDGGEVSRDSSLIQRSIAVNLLPIEPSTPAPLGAFDEPPAVIPPEITDEEAAAAESLPSQIRSEDDPDTVPEDLEEAEDPWDSEPTASPTLSVSDVSSLMLLGSGARFSTQQLGVLGTDLGGPISLQGVMEFPQVPLAFGESMLFSQSDLASGWFDPASGEVTLQVPVVAIDSDGNAAPMVLSLTTGTAIARNSVGSVVSLTGTPMLYGSGLMKLVGISKIPVGFRNGAEDHIVMVEIMATLNFGVSISQIPAAHEGSTTG